MIFMSPVLSPSLTLVRRTTSFLRYEWMENLSFQVFTNTSYLLFNDEFNAFFTFWKFEPSTTNDNFCPLRVTWELSFAESAGDNSYFLSYDVYHTQVPILRYEWRENSFFQLVPATSHTSCFAMILIFPVLSSCLSLVAGTTSIPGYEGRENLIFQKVPETRDNSYLLFYDDFDAPCTFSKFNSCRTHDQFSPLWVTEEFDIWGLPKDKWYLLLHDELNALSTFWKFEPSTTKDNFCPLRMTWELSFAESAGDNCYVRSCDV